MSITQLKYSSNKSQYFDNAKMELVEGDTYNHASYDRVFPLGQVRISFENAFVSSAITMHRRDTYINVEAEDSDSIVRYRIDTTEFIRDSYSDIQSERLFVKKIDDVFEVPKKGYHFFAISWSNIEKELGYDVFPYWFCILVLNKYGNYVSIIDDCWSNDFSSAKEPRLVHCADSKLVTLHKFNDINNFCAKMIMRGIYVYNTIKS